MEDGSKMGDVLDFDEPGDPEELGGDEAEFLLDELEEFVMDVEPGSGEGDEEVKDEMERLLESLEAIAGPVALDPATPARIASWTRVLVTDGAHEDRGGPEEVRTLVQEELNEFRRVLQSS